MYKSNHFQPYPEPDAPAFSAEWLRWFHHHYYLPVTPHRGGMSNKPREQMLPAEGEEIRHHEQTEWKNALI